MLDFPGIGQTVAVGVCPRGDGIGPYVSKSIAQADPTAVCAVGISAQVACLEVHLWRTSVLEVDPSDVGAVSKPAQVAQAVLIDAPIRGGMVLELNPVSRRSVHPVTP